jgi:regulator of replication initiation timing
MDKKHPPIPPNVKGKKMKKIIKLKKVKEENKKLQKENKELKKFKKKAEEECEASAVMESMMDKLEKTQNNYENLMDNIVNYFELLTEIPYQKEDMRRKRQPRWIDKMEKVYSIINFDLENPYILWKDLFEERYNIYSVSKKEFERLDKKAGSWRGSAPPLSDSDDETKNFKKKENCVAFGTNCYDREIYYIKEWIED